MKPQFCTIVTADHVGFALALHDSIRRHGDTGLCVMVAAGHPHAGAALPEREGLRWVPMEALCADGMGAALYDAYVTQGHMDAFRWSMKPVLMQALLAEGCDRVVCMDADVRFFADYRFLFERLGECNVLLSPHGRCADPMVDPGNFEKLFTEGHFNGGFVGATAGGVPALAWWADLCLYACDKRIEAGHYDDQRYLDFMPLEFPGVGILDHPGCNLAEWNCRRWRYETTPDGGVLLEGRWPVVFMHFASMEAFCAHPEAAALRPCFEDYFNGLALYDAPAAARLRRRAAALG